jgi:DNA-binding beta-propeller fold protein YncE
MQHSLSKGLIFPFILLLIFALDVSAQGSFVYTNNFNTISAFSVGPDGVLAEVPGSPFPKQGLSSSIFTVADNIKVSPSGNFLYVANGDHATISVFSINPLTGFLTPVPGSPFDTSMVIGSMSLAVSPDNHFLFAANADRERVAAFTIALNGALTPVAGSPFFYPYLFARAKVTPDDRILGLAVVDQAATFHIASNGVLSFAHNSPFLGRNAGDMVGMDINCAGNLMFASEEDAGTKIHVFNLSSDGALTPIMGSPFSLQSGTGAREIRLSPDDKLLFVLNDLSHSITVLNVAPEGSLSLAPGSPYILSNRDSDRIPEDLETDRAGKYLFTANDDGTLSVFSIAGSGTLNEVSGSPFPNHNGFGVSIAVYPAKSCSPAFNLCIQDDSNGNLLQVNTTTGDYQFTNCGGLTLGGTGTVTKRGSQITLQHNAPDRRVMATLDTSTNRATASIQLFSQGRTFSITDRDITNNTCACK